jgi:putative hydrolase of the HAD superfamily
MDSTVQHIRAITLDLDDTLWEITPVIRRAEAELWAWLAANYPGITGRFTPESASGLRQQVLAQHANRSHDLRFLRKAVLLRMAEDAGYPTDLVEPAFQVFDAARNRVRLFDDVLPALQVLSQRFPIIALTNGNANLETIGVRQLFAGVVTAEEAGAAKPSPAIFECAMQRSGLSAAEILHVGDHPDIDVVGAGDAGLTTAWMNRRGSAWPRHLRPPDAIVTTMHELQALLMPAAGGDRLQNDS